MKYYWTAEKIERQASSFTDDELAEGVLFLQRSLATGKKFHAHTGKSSWARQDRKHNNEVQKFLETKLRELKHEVSKRKNNNDEMGKN